MLFRSPNQISKHYDNTFWEKSNKGRRERKNAINSRHLAQPAQRHLAHKSNVFKKNMAANLPYLPI